MSPLKIIMLMRLRSRAHPFDDMPEEQIVAPAMQEAFGFFRNHGLLADHVTWISVKHGRAGYPFLSFKGHQLVERLCEVEP
jgi:hypothetical protein